MKTKLSALLVGFFFIFSGSAFALSYSDVEVYDNLIADTDMTGYEAYQGEAKEIAFLADKLGVDYSVVEANYSKWEDSSNIWTATVDDPNTFYFDFGTKAPTHFLLKTGGGQAVDSTWFLYENNVSLQYGVIRFADFDGFFNIDWNIGMVSHVSIGDDTPVDVPEPATLLLFGAGLAGLAVYRRRSSK